MRMMARFLWILNVFGAVVSAREIWVKDFGKSDILNEELEIEPYIFENKILDAIYKLKNFLKNGDPENGIPPVDPFFLPYKDFDFILRDTELAGYLQNVTITGFSRFEPDSVELKLLPLHFKLDLGIDHFKVDGRYKLRGKILDVPVDGIGEFISEIGNLTVCLYLRLTTADNSFQIRDIIFDFKTLRVKVNSTNELNSDRFEVLNEDMVLNILDQVQDNYVPPLLNTAKILLNRFLLGYSTGDVLNFIIKLLQNKSSPLRERTRTEIFNSY